MQPAPNFNMQRKILSTFYNFFFRVCILFRGAKIIIVNKTTPTKNIQNASSTRSRICIYMYFIYAQKAIERWRQSRCSLKLKSSTYEVEAPGKADRKYCSRVHWHFLVRPASASFLKRDTGKYFRCLLRLSAILGHCGLAV